MTLPFEPTTDLIPAQSVESIVATYQDAKAKIVEACRQIDEQQNRIAETFGDHSYIRLETEHLRFYNPGDKLKEMDRRAWAVRSARATSRATASCAAKSDPSSRGVPLPGP